MSQSVPPSPNPTHSTECFFVLTYGIRLKDVYGDLPITIITVWWSVKHFSLYSLTNAVGFSEIQIQKSQPVLRNSNSVPHVQASQKRSVNQINHSLDLGCKQAKLAVD